MGNVFIQEIEQEAQDLGLSINTLCEEAGIARSTFTRQKSGETKGGNIKTITKLKTVLAKHKIKNTNTATN